MERLVPIALHENAAGGAPDIMGRHPDPFGMQSHPEARPPEITSFAIDPATRHISIVDVWGWRGRSVVGRWRRRRQVLHLLHLGIRPESGNPLPTIGDLLPVAGQPDFARRKIAPAATHPEKIVLLVIPS